MAKSRGFSIYLLKDTFSATNSLKDDHSLEQIVEDNTNLPTGALMYIANRPGSPPWWKSYWGITKTLYQMQKSAIVFLPVDSRWVVLTFGIVHHQLKDNCYEYDFGLRTTLNALDPRKIKSTDILQPENAKRQRIQSPTASSLTFFDIRHDESIIKKLTGSVKPEYVELFKSVTGASSLRISSNLLPNQITGLCRNLIDIYSKTDYLQAFPDIQNIVPVKDPDEIQILNQQLLSAFREAPVDLVLAIPDLIDYSAPFKIKYSGAGRSNTEYNDVFIGGYRQYLQEREISEIEDVDLFYSHKMKIIDENNEIIDSYSIYKTFLFDCEVNGRTYHLCDGEWYFIETDYVQRLCNSIDSYFVDDHPFLQQCNHIREDDYNLSVASASILCLDKKNIAPNGQTQIEPCDLISVSSVNNTVNLTHVKISTRSSSLSHLFNQGVNSVELLRMNAESRQKLKNLVDNDTAISHFIDDDSYSVTYGIITKKNRVHRSKNLPIFSRISLLRALNTLKMMGIPCSVYFILDNVDRRENNELDQ